MQIFTLKHSNKKIILALGAESAGNFSVQARGKIYFSEDFGDLLVDKNFQNYQSKLNHFLKSNKVKPEIILTDLHPLYRTTELGVRLSQKYAAKQLQIQHHLAHIFGAVGEALLAQTAEIADSFFGLACDGTGYGLDDKIWGGEVFKFTANRSKIIKVERIGQLENQTMVGADLAVKEPARMLLGILAKFLEKKQVYNYLKKYYSAIEFAVLYNQLRSGFNTAETSSTGRILDAVSLLLGFTGNERKFKHQPTRLLEINSTVAYENILPQLLHDKNEKKYILLTTPLFKYLIKNLQLDKKRLAATAQTYLARGFYGIIKKNKKAGTPFYLGGGLSANKIISAYFSARGASTNKKIPAGDAGLSFGQLVYYLFS